MSEKPVRIPLSFNDAIGGLLAVDPKKLPRKRRAAAKKKAPKRAAKKGNANRSNQAKG